MREGTHQRADETAVKEHRVRFSGDTITYEGYQNGGGNALHLVVKDITFLDESTTLENDGGDGVLPYE